LSTGGARDLLRFGDVPDAAQETAALAMALQVTGAFSGAALSINSFEANHALLRGHCGPLISRMPRDADGETGQCSF
jgi:hypothetical protein